MIHILSHFPMPHTSMILSSSRYGPSQHSMQPSFETEHARCATVVLPDTGTKPFNQTQ